jgi:hypothetical protein
MMNIEHEQIYSSELVNKSIVYEYSRHIKYQDTEGLLSLFTDDAIVYEPFSNIKEGLQGKSAIRPFLEIVMMANSGLTHSIVIEKPYTKDDNNNHDNHNETEEYYYNTDKDINANKITALVTFQRGDSIRARYTFNIVPILMESNGNVICVKKKIQRLNIQFIG